MRKHDGANPLPRRDAHADRFVEINRKQDARQAKLAKEAAANSTTVEAEGEVTDPSVQAWLDQFAESIKSGRRQKEGGAGRLNEFADRVVIPRYIGSKIGRTFGDQQRFQDKGDTWDSKKPFTLKTLTAELGCSRREAATLLTFIILLSEKSNIELAMRRPEIYHDLKIPVDQARLQAMFKSEEFMNQVTNAALEASLPLLAREAEVEGVHRIIDHLRIFQFKPDASKLRAAFANDARRLEFRRYMQADLKKGLEVLPTYENLFGELSRAEFEELFPNWHATDSLRYGVYQRRYKLEQPKPPATEVAPSVATASPEEPVVAQPEPAVTVTQVVPAAPVVQPTPHLPDPIVEPVTIMEPRREPPSRQALLRAARWGAVGLTLSVGVGGMALEAGKALIKADQGDTSDEFEPSPTKAAAQAHREQEGKYTYVPSLEQRHQIESNNRGGVEVIKIEQGDFVAEPPLHGMRATDVFTTIGPNGLVTYEPEHAFAPDRTAMEELALTDHLVAERVFAQGKILYPPELGLIEPTSIYLDGYTTDQYTVTEGEQGRFLVTLNEPPTEPFKIVYLARELDGDIVPFTAEQPALPEIGNPELLEHVRSHGLERYANEDEYTFALRVSRTIQAEYHYPRGQAEEGLPFNKAVEKHIGDCDVVNQEVVAALQDKGIHAEIVADSAPVPGREKHGQARAIVYSAKLDATVIVALDATPYTFTAASRVESVPKPAVAPELEPTVDVQPSQTQLDKAELAALINKYQEEFVGESLLENTPTEITEPEPDETILEPEEVDAGVSDASGVSEPGLPDSQTVQPTPGEDTTEFKPVSDKEWQALQGGLYGYAHYLLRHSLSLPDNKAARVRLTTEFMLTVMQELQYKGVIKANEDPFEWSKHITAEDARKVVDTLNQSPVIRSRLNLFSSQERIRQLE